MKIKLSSYLLVLSAISVLLANATLSFADNQMESFSLNSEEATGQDFEEVVEELVKIPVTEENTGESMEAIVQEIQDRELEQERFLNRIQQELNLSKSDYHQLLNNIADTKDRLDQVSEEKISLKIQIRNLDALIALSSEKLLDVIYQVVEVENDIALLYEEIQTREVAVEYQKELLRDYIRVMYEEESLYLSVDENGDLNTIKLLLADGSVGDTLKDLQYLDLLNVTGQQMLDKLADLHGDLLYRQEELEQKRAKLDSLKTEIAVEKQRLETQKDAKENLLVLTTGQEEIYQQLLEQSLEEQMSVVENIRLLSNALAFIEKDIASNGDEFDPDFYNSILSEKQKAIYDFQLRYRGLNPDGFSWPVEPFKGISAFFRDPSYVGVFGVRHSAVDIPTYQGTPIRSAADGVVFTTKDNGYGYSYIIVAHSGGLSTVYGHVSKILVNEGDTVAEGSIIGLSGGMPGTKGAGYMTTGPHLHFEVHFNGEYVDPLEYLPLEVLTEDQINALPEKYFSAWETAVYGVSSEHILRF